MKRASIPFPDENDSHFGYRPEKGTAPCEGKAKLIGEIIIHAPLNKVFVLAADLTRWPEFLPHYRYIRFVTHTPTGGIVKMCCVRRRILTTWTSDFRIDTVKHELRLHHLKSTLNATLKVVEKDNSLESLIRAGHDHLEPLAGYRDFLAA